VREKARLKKAEKFMLDALQTFEEREGVPIVLLDSYEDAVDRYGLRDSRLSDELPTAGEAITRARLRQGQLTEAMAAFSLDGGGDRWREFQERLEDFVAAGGRAVVLAQKVLRKPGVDFSEYTDPAFAGLVERD
jgi:hypothetical protein